MEVAAAVVSTQRDWGNRSNRKNAKTKYTLDRVGVEVFKAEVENARELRLHQAELMSLPAVAIGLVGLKASMANII